MSASTFLPKTNVTTSILGWVAVIAGAIMANPDAISFLPDSIESAIKGISTLVAFIAGGAFVSSVKNKEVTGGTIPANEEALNRILLHIQEESGSQEPEQRETPTETELDIK